MPTARSEELRSPAQRVADAFPPEVMSDRATEALRRRMSPELGAARRALAWAGVPEWPPTGLLREPPRKRENPLVGRADTPVRLGYWSYLGLGSLLMLILSLIYASWTIAALAVVVLALATHRLYVLRTDPDE